MDLVCRPVETSDYAGVMACLERHNMPTASRERWLAIWDEYPHRDDFKDIPRGFVLDANGVIVGSITSVWAKYWLSGNQLRATIAGNAAVDHAYRAGSVQLFGQQLLQPGVDLYLNGSASANTSKIMDTLKVLRVPQPDNDLGFLWATRGSRVAHAGLKRRGVPMARALSWLVGSGLRLASRLKLRQAGGANYPVAIEGGFTDAFDELWRTIRDRSTTLVGFRDRGTLHWRYARAIAAGNAVLLTVKRDGLLAAYAVLMRTPHPALGIVANSVHDFQCVDEDPGLVGSLLHAAWKETRARSLDLLEWFGFSGSKRAIAERASLLRYRLDVWQAFYFTRNRSLKQELSVPERWDFGPYDSD